MEIVEGHAQHVTDVVAAELGSLPNFDMTRWSRRLRLALRATKTLNPVLRVLRLPRPEVRVSLGHREGLEFCNFAAKAGVLNRLFQAPETLPNADELADPEQWLGRIRQKDAQTGGQDCTAAYPARPREGQRPIESSGWECLGQAQLAPQHCAWRA